MREMHAWLASASHGGEKITPILQREYDHGEYKDGRKKWSQSISSVLIVGVTLRHAVAMLPPEIVVMVLINYTSIMLLARVLEVTLAPAVACAGAAARSGGRRRFTQKQ